MMLPSLDLLSDIQAYCDATNPVGSLANVSAAIYNALPQLNWVGFYISDGQQLRLGPFQGRPACTHIAYHRGVCGAAFTQKKTMCVNDIHTFKDHIVCDAASRSEVVVPLFKDGVVWGVLDVDSPQLDRFSQDDVKFFEQISHVISVKLQPPTTWFTYS